MKKPAQPAVGEAGFIFIDWKPLNKFLRFVEKCFEIDQLNRSNFVWIQRKETAIQPRMIGSFFQHHPDDFNISLAHAYFSDMSYAGDRLIGTFF